MAGRPPKPTRTKELLGTLKSCRVNKAEPMPKRGRPVCPAWLDDEAKKKWRKLVPELDRLRLLTVVDGDVLAAYCQAWAEFKWATEVMQKEGRTGTRGTGGSAPHPAVAMQRSAWKAIKEFASLFGLDPSSRTKLSAPPVQQEDPFEKLLNEDAG